MRSRLFFLLILSSILDLGSAFGAVSVVPLWTIPTRQTHDFELKPYEHTRPLVIDDILVYGNLEGRVVAVHRTDGYVLWSRKLLAPVDGALAYGRAKIFVGDTQGNFYALNTRDGSINWQNKVASEWLAPPAVTAGKVFAFTSSDELYVFADGTGKELWHYSHRGDEKMTVNGTSGPSVYGNEVYQGFSDGSLVALNANTGAVRWSKRLRSRIRFYDVDTTPYVDSSRVIAGAYDGKVYSVNRMTGESLWVASFGSYSAVGVFEDRAYFSGLDGKVHALDLSSGKELWSTGFDPSNESRGVGLQPVLVGNTLIVTTSSDPVLALDPVTGKVLWRGNLGAGSLAPAVSHPDGVFYCQSNYGNVYAFQVRETFQSLWRMAETIVTPSAINRFAWFKHY